ncbi:MAG TPA: LPS assembly lipoprotein LptE [Burkholderiales bacterium]|nr:LPS assembly lipoprotein LptE [Burkholderiales bacterium]
MRRRAWLAGAGLLALHACGFRPMKPVAIPFENLYVAPSDYSSFAAEFRRYVESYSRARLASDPKAALATLEILGEQQQKQILSLSGAGRVTEYLLRYHVAFKVRDKSGKELIGPSDISLERDMAYNDNAILGKENEEAFLFQDMRQDAIQQLVRRLATIKLAEVPPAS